MKLPAPPRAVLLVCTTHGKSFCVVFDSGNEWMELDGNWGNYQNLYLLSTWPRLIFFFALEDFRCFTPWKSRKFLCVKDIFVAFFSVFLRGDSCCTFIHVDLVQYLDHMKMICFRIGVLSSGWVRESWVCVGSYLHEKHTKELPGVLDTWYVQGWSICDLTFNAVRTRWSVFHLKVGVARVTDIARWFSAVNKAP